MTLKKSSEHINIFHSPEANFQQNEKTYTEFRTPMETEMEKKKTKTLCMTLIVSESQVH